MGIVSSSSGSVWGAVPLTSGVAAGVAPGEGGAKTILLIPWRCGCALARVSRVPRVSFGYRFVLWWGRFGGRSFDIRAGWGEDPGEGGAKTILLIPWRPGCALARVSRVPRVLFWYRLVLWWGLFLLHPRWLGADSWRGRWENYTFDTLAVRLRFCSSGRFLGYRLGVVS